MHALLDETWADAAMVEGKKIRVFIADDSATVRERLISLLSDMPAVEVIGTASDAAEAIVAIQQLKPDVVILDIRMPAGSGIGVLRSLQQAQSKPKFIMLTNYPFFSTARPASRRVRATSSISRPSLKRSLRRWSNLPLQPESDSAAGVTPAA
jgi:DNA-binding NarL/FixJ family response regulator